MNTFPDYANPLADLQRRRAAPSPETIILAVLTGFTAGFVLGLLLCANLLCQ